MDNRRRLDEHLFMRLVRATICRPIYGRQVVSASAGVVAERRMIGLDLLHARNLRDYDSGEPAWPLPYHVPTVSIHDDTRSTTRSRTEGSLFLRIA